MNIQVAERKNDLVQQFEKAGVRFRKIPDSPELELDCPVCGKEKHLYINSVKRVGHCQRCKEPFNWRRIVKEFHLPTRSNGGLLSSAPTLLEIRQMAEAVFCDMEETPEESEDLPHCTFQTQSPAAERV